ncbi:MAG: GDP-mannose 4,6-dehydratase [Desulfuromonadaceae bacterium]|nr:GDP-mannose 4,6-dehydratase [Desulfuromonadaceae bacterium]
MKKALITGITGQDGSYLAELLLGKGYEVHGMVRRSSSFNTGRIDHLYRDPHEKDVRMFLHYGDLNDASSINTLLRNIQPEEIYNLGAQSHVRVSFDIPEYTGEIDALGAVRILEGIREAGLNTRFYQASSSELYGKVIETPQKETTPFYPRSPYACAKAYAFYITMNYRESYGLHASNGILFNHESPRRGETFVTRKITRAAARIKLGMQHCLYLGNIDAKRDWGFAGDYVEAMWRMLQQDQAEDYVIATGEAYMVRTFAEKVFDRLGMPLEWQGNGVDEKGIDTTNGKTVIQIDPKYFRPAEVDLLLGDPTKARKQLNWELKTSFGQLVNMMTDADLALAEREKRADG